MPDPITTATVAVKFLEFNKVQSEGESEDTHYKAFLFEPIKVSTLTAAEHGPSNYTVTLNLDSNVPNAFIVEVEPTTTSADILWTLSNQGKTITGTFSNEGITEANKKYGFKLKISAGGAVFISTDPEIEVPPPNG